MIYVGIDDTDTLDDPGTNQLARHLVRELASDFRGRIILRHQLLEDPRVPCTKKNGCASIIFERARTDRSPPTDGEGLGEERIVTLVDALRGLMRPWCPKGSDPGLCVTHSVPGAVAAWGLRCQREFVSQAEARDLASRHGIHLEGLGGSEDGVIGALAAVGLMATKNDGRVVYYDSHGTDWYDLTGCHDVGDIRAHGVDEVLDIDSGEPIITGTVDIGKRLRPNFRKGRIVLYVTRNDAPHWEAVRIT